MIGAIVAIFVSLWFDLVLVGRWSRGKVVPPSNLIISAASGTYLIWYFLLRH
jgi:hypothetical protein